MLPSKRCNSMVGAQVALKSHIRDKALSNLHAGREGDATKERLRYSHFATDKVFGPLTKTQADLFAHSNPLRNDYQLDIKLIQHWNGSDWKAPNSQVKRLGSTSFSPAQVIKTQGVYNQRGVHTPRASNIRPSQAAQNY